MCSCSKDSLCGVVGDVSLVIRELLLVICYLQIAVVWVYCSVLRFQGLLIPAMSRADFLLCNTVMSPDW